MPKAHAPVAILLTKGIYYMCETIKPSSWDQGGILRDIFVITRTIDDAIDAALDFPAKF
jgi:energy-converting hydrogenase Eha subunit F